MEQARSRPRLVASAELWAALAWLGLSVFVTWAGRDIGTGTVAAPGSGFLPFWAGLLMCGFSLAVLRSAVAEGGPSVASLWAGVRWRNVVLMVAALAIYAALLEPLGFLLATIPLLLVLLRGVDPVPWRTAIPVAVLSTLGVWWVLKRALLIQLPTGLFEVG